MRRLKSYSRISLRFISIGGQRVLHSHQQLRSLVLRRLQRPDVANLFSTPEEDTGKNEFIWYTSLPGTIIGFEALPEAGADRRSLEAEILEAATTVPDDSCKFMVGSQPVLAAWGSTLAASSRSNVDVIWTAQASEPRPIKASQPKASVLDTPPEEMPGHAAGAGAAVRARGGSLTRLRHFVWLLPLLAGLMLAVFADKLVGQNSNFELLRLFPSLSAPSAGGAIDQEADLRREVVDLEKKLVSRLDACPAPPTRHGSTAPPLPIPPQVAEKGDSPSSPPPKPIAAGCREKGGSSAFVDARGGAAPVPAVTATGAREEGCISSAADTGWPDGTVLVDPPSGLREKRHFVPVWLLGRTCSSGWVSERDANPCRCGALLRCGRQDRKANDTKRKNVL